MSTIKFLEESINFIFSKFSCMSEELDLEAAKWIRDNRFSIVHLGSIEFIRFVMYLSDCLLSGRLGYAADELSSLIQFQLYFGILPTNLCWVNLVSELHSAAYVNIINYHETNNSKSVSIHHNSVLAISMPKSAGTFLSSVLANNNIPNYDGHLIGNPTLNFLSPARLQAMSVLGLSVTHSHVNPSFFNLASILGSPVQGIWIHLRRDILGTLKSFIKMAQFEHDVFINNSMKEIVTAIKSKTNLDYHPLILNELDYYFAFRNFWESSAIKLMSSRKVLVTYYEDFMNCKVECVNRVCDFYSVGLIESEVLALFEDKDRVSKRIFDDILPPVQISDVFSASFLNEIGTKYKGISKN